MSQRECGLLLIIILRKLILCRDRFGEKPLYIYKNNYNFVFGSSVDYILNITNINHKIDKNK